MHPAPSLIVFTTLSGFGFGLMVWLGVGLGPDARWAAASWSALALAAASAGLLASLAHLGNPQRAWRALSQWRSSWLSREGVAAVATLAVFFSHAALAFAGRPMPGLGWLAAGLALGTVLCTAMIYAQLRAVPRWNTLLTPTVFLLAALAGPAVLLGLRAAALALLAALAAALVAHWRQGDGGLAARSHGMAGATGLSDFAGAGRVRSLEPPHTGRNYLLDEMVFRVARRRSAVLRRVTLVAGGVLPAAIVAALPVLPAPVLAAWIAFLLHGVGIVASRWLFFAEAEHAVSLYYGR